MGIIYINVVCGYKIDLNMAKPELIQLLKIKRDDQWFIHTSNVRFPDGLEACVRVTADHVDETNQNGFSPKFRAIIGFDVSKDRELESDLCSSQSSTIMPVDEIIDVLNNEKSYLEKLKETLNSYMLQDGYASQAKIYLTA